MEPKYVAIKSNDSQERTSSHKEPHETQSVTIRENEPQWDKSS